MCCAHGLWSPVRVRATSRQHPGLLGCRALPGSVLGPPVQAVNPDEALEPRSISDRRPGQETSSLASMGMLTLVLPMVSRPVTSAPQGSLGKGSMRIARPAPRRILVVFEGNVVSLLYISRGFRPPSA